MACIACSVRTVQHKEAANACSLRKLRACMACSIRSLYILVILYLIFDIARRLKVLNASCVIVIVFVCFSVERVREGGRSESYVICENVCLYSAFS